MGTRWVIGSAIFCLVVSSEFALAQHQKPGDKTQAPKESTSLPNCPVMSDEPVNFAISLATPEGPVYFCCKDCIPKYQADPTKYAAKVSAQRKALAGRSKAQVACPACKEPADAKIFLESGGQKILFSSTECMDKYKKDPGKYASALANSYTYQTRCPIMAESIDPKSFTTLAGGTRVYFCCKGCDKKFLADPSKYAPKLAEQGFVFEPKELTPNTPKEEDPANNSKGP